MNVYNETGLTFNQIAENQTIGGRQYGLAIARHNGYENPDSQAPAVIDIPQDWLGNQRVVLVGRPPETTPPPAARQWINGVPNQTVAYAAAAILLVLAFAGNRG